MGGRGDLVWGKTTSIEFERDFERLSRFAKGNKRRPVWRSFIYPQAYPNHSQLNLLFRTQTILSIYFPII